MSNTALVTAASKQAARDNLNDYAQVLYAHLSGGWEQHGALLLHTQAFHDGSGDVVSALTARFGLTLDTADSVVAVPIIATTIVTDTGAVPLITVQPSTLTVVAGTTAVLSVVGVSATTITYQWYLNGEAIDGETHAQLVLINAQTDDEAQYYVVLTNDAGSVTSSTASITVTGDSDGRTGGSGAGPTDELP